MEKRTAVITGASAGIGEATARALAKAGFQVVLGARRLDRLEKLAEELSGVAYPLDLTDLDSVADFVAQLPDCHVLVNNAGGARGLERIEAADEAHWRWMWEVNVLGSLRITKALLPKLIESGQEDSPSHVVTVTSVAGHEVYDGGAGYTSAKHAESAFHRTLRSEHLSDPIRFTEIVPGMVETDFSLNRFDGDTERAAGVYQGMRPLVAEDVADVIQFAVTRPSQVNLDQIVIKPRAQYNAVRSHRNA